MELEQIRRKITALENKQRVSMSNSSLEAKCLKNEGSTLKATSGVITSNVVIKAPNIPDDLVQKVQKIDDIDEDMTELSNGIAENAQDIGKLNDAITELKNNTSLNTSDKADRHIIIDELHHRSYVETPGVLNPGFMMARDQPVILFGPLTSSLSFKGCIRIASKYVNMEIHYNHLTKIVEVQESITCEHKIYTLDDELYFAAYIYDGVNECALPYIDGVGNCQQSNFIIEYYKNLTESSGIEITSDRLTTLETLVNGLTSQILQKAYPVGAIYISMNETNPNTVFGFGTWSRITNCYLYCTAYTGGRTGGSLKIKAGNLPAHTHGYTTYKSVSGRVMESNQGFENYFWYNTDTAKTTSTGDGVDYYPPYTTVIAWYRTA